MVAERLVWIGVYPGLTATMLDFVVEVIHDFVTASKAVRG
jgi:hypothetical protein